MQPSGPEMIAPVFGAVFFIAFLLVILAVNILFIIAFCKICSKAGYHWAMGLLMLIPIANLIMLCILAFGQWPIQRELEALRRSTMAPPPEGQPHDSFRGN